MRRRPKLGYLVSHPIQYQAPLFRKLAASQSIDFVALFGCDFGVRPSYDPQFGRVVDFGIDLLGGFRSVFVRQVSTDPSIERFWGLRTPSIQTAWQAEALDVLVLHGWRTAMLWQAAMGALRNRRPYLMRAETPLFNAAGASAGVAKRARNLAVRQLLNKAAGALALGTANERFYLRNGVPPERIWRVPYFVDNDAVGAQASHGREKCRDIRGEIGVPSEAVLLVAVGKLIPRKRPLDLVRLLASLPAHVHLAWIGSGELDPVVRAEASASGIADRVHLLGFQPAEATWRIMGASDLFLHPGEDEPWGLVINEAVAARIPAIVSNRCGAAEDLIVPDRTGEIVPVGDLPAWVSAASKWLARLSRGNKGDVQEMVNRADAHSIQRAAAMIEDVVLTLQSHHE